MLTNQKEIVRIEQEIEEVNKFIDKLNEEHDMFQT